MMHKIPILLAEAERQSQSPDPEKSSLARATRQFTDASAAEENFKRLKEKLFRIEKWNSESGVSHFELYDDSGKKIKNQPAAVNDFIKITLPGSGKNDWVKIIEIHEAPGEAILTVQPTYDPTAEKPDETVTSHFFTADARNNFCLERDRETLNFYVIGLSEMSNTGDTNNILESARNFAAANLGHYLGAQTVEWTVFCQNFLETEESEKVKK
jgi:hypothetical protein